MTGLSTQSLFTASTYPNIAPSLRGGHVAIGNFDGMHRGHQAVLENVRSTAEKSGAPAVVLTFEPHPRDFFKPDQPVFRLTPAAAKRRIAQAIGLRGLVTVPFDAQLAALPADAFIADVLVGALHLRGIAAGWNFHFGAGRSGNPISLAEAGRRHGFTVAILPPFESGDGNAVSSSRIRVLLEEGDIDGAAALLGYRWFLNGSVVSGDKRGRTIGYPTANVRLPVWTRLRHGIYAVFVTIDGVRREGVASWGRRPTFDNGAPVFETFLFEFTGDLYGKDLTITPVRWLRPELRFSSVVELVAQMDEDSAKARAILKAATPLSPLDAALLGES